MVHFPKCKNDRWQDLVLLSKYWYRKEGEYQDQDLIKAVKIVIQYHNGWNLKSLPSNFDTLSVMVHDTLPYLMKYERAIANLLVKGFAKDWYFGDDGSIPPEERMIDSVMSALTGMPGKAFGEDGLPEVDQFLFKLLNDPAVQKEYGLP